MYIKSASKFMLQKGSKQ